MGQVISNPLCFPSSHPLMLVQNPHPCHKPLGCPWCVQGCPLRAHRGAWSAAAGFCCVLLPLGQLCVCLSAGCHHFLRALTLLPKVSLRLQGTLEALMHEGLGTVGGNCCLHSVLPPNHPAHSCCLKEWSGIKHFNVYLRSSLPGNQDSMRLESGQWVQTDWSLKPDSPVQKPSILKKVLTFFELQHLHL